MDAAIKIIGDKRLLKKLRELRKRVQNKVNRRAVNLATTILVREAKAQAPVEDGDLKKSLTKKVYNRGMRASGIVGADRNYVIVNGRKANARDVYDGRRRKAEFRDAQIKRPSNYDHLVEFGHVGPGGQMVPAHPFLRPAFESSIDGAANKYESELAAGIEKESQA